MTRCAARFAWIAPLVLLCALASSGIGRPGYSPDEEITAVTVDAIGRTGLPLLPSGVLYHRGFPYPYLAWSVGVFAGQSLVSYRLASLACALLALVVAYRMGWKLGGLAAALAASFFLAAFPAFVSAAVFARQYSALVLCALLFVLCFWNWTAERRRGWVVLLVFGCAVLLHPAGALLAALPMIHIATGDRLPSSWRMTAAVACTAIVATCAPYGLHLWSVRHAGLTFSRLTAIYAIPTPSLPAVYVTGLAGPLAWCAATLLFTGLGVFLFRVVYRSVAILLMIAAGLVFQLGVVVLVAAVLALLRPARLRHATLCAASVILASTAWWTLLAASVTDAQYSRAFAWSLVSAAFMYPYAALTYTRSVLPAVWWLGLASVALAMSKTEDAGQVRGRQLALLALAILTAFSVLAVPMTERYLVLPWTILMLLAALGTIGLIRATAQFVSSIGSPRTVIVGAATAVAACTWQAVGLYHYGSLRAEEMAVSPDTGRALSPRTGATWTRERMRAFVRPGDNVICTEEVACLYLIGRVDYLLALPPADSAHYVSWRAGTPLGFYAGRPALISAAQLHQMVRDVPHKSCSVFITLNSGKVGFDYYSALGQHAVSDLQSQVLFSGPEAFVSRMCGGKAAPLLVAEGSITLAEGEQSGGRQ